MSLDPSFDCTDGNGRDNVREMENLRLLVGYSDFKIDSAEQDLILYFYYPLQQIAQINHFYSDDVL